MEQITATAMEIFMKIDDDADKEDDEVETKDSNDEEHINKKQKTIDPVAYAIELTADDAVKIALAAVDYHFGSKDRWEFGCDAIPWAKDYAEKVVAKSKELKNLHGDMFNANEIVKAFNETPQEAK